MGCTSSNTKDTEPKAATDAPATDAPAAVTDAPAGEAAVEEPAKEEWIVDWRKRKKRMKQANLDF